MPRLRVICSPFSLCLTVVADTKEPTAPCLTSRLKRGPRRLRCSKGDTSENGLSEWKRDECSVVPRETTLGNQGRWIGKRLLARFSKSGLWLAMIDKSVGGAEWGGAVQ